MSLPPLPPGAKLDAQPSALPPLPPGARLDRTEGQPDTGVPGSPLEKALAEQTGDVVTVETPTGPTQFTRSGAPFMGPEASAQMGAAADARFKERVLEGGLSFLSGGGPLVDEFAGLGAAGSPKTWREGEGPLDAYRRGRESARRDVASATRNASPSISIAGAKIPVLPALGAALPSMMAPLPLGAFGRILSSGVQGAESAFGNSEADLTRGDVTGALRDTGIGAGTGLAAAGVAEGVTAPLRFIAGRAGQEASAAKDAVTAARQAAADKAAASAQGDLGRLGATQGNSMETVMDVLRNPQWFPDEVVQEAYAIAQSPEGKAMLARAATNNMAKLRSSFAAEPGVRGALASAQSAASPSAVAADVAARTAPEAIVNDVGSKTWSTIGKRAALGAAGSAVGSGIGWLTGNEDAAKGGGLMGGLIGINPGVLRFAENQSRSPVVQYGANALVQKLLNQGAGAVAKTGAAAAPVLQQDEEESVKAFLSGG